MIKPLDFAKLLIEQRSITPNDSGLQHQIFQYLSEYGFRLPSCKDNRPLNFDEWNGMRSQTIYVPLHQ